MRQRATQLILPFEPALPGRQLILAPRLWPTMTPTTQQPLAKRVASVYDWQGAQITLICFDELTHFSAHQFFYMVSRNRSTCGVRPYIRATCNPDADSWVADLLAWWIDQETGLPIRERAGVVRYYIRIAAIGSDGVRMRGE